jgi:hypothetical protein
MDERKIERMFYHDMLNLVASMRGISEVICDVDEPTRAEMLSLLGSLAGTMLETLQTRRIYRGIEANDLTLTFSSVDCRKLLSRMANLYRKHTLCQSKALEVLSEPPECQGHPITLFIDQDVLQGALGYGVRTALESLGNGQILTLGVTQDEHAEPPAVLFSIAFPGTLSEQEQQAVFQKPEGVTRGMTGFSAYVFHTLITCYLKGAVEWTTHENVIRLLARFPLQPEAHTSSAPESKGHG